MREIQNVVGRLDETVQKMGLKINEEKTKFSAWTYIWIIQKVKVAVPSRNGRKYTKISG